MTDFFNIKVNDELNDSIIQDEFFIFMFRTTKIPPHLGVVVEGKVYDITVNGPTVGLEVSQFLRLIHQKSIETLFIQLDLHHTNFNKKDLIEEKIVKYKQVTELVTCLTPIKEIVSEFYQINVSKVNFIFELLPLLSKKKLITNVYHLNMGKQIENSVFRLKKYTMEDIQESIRCLKNRKKHKQLC